MTALGKIFRTTAFKLSLAYLLIFTVFAFVALGYVAWNAVRVLDNELQGAMEAEARSLTEQYREGGIRQLYETIESRSQGATALYLLTNPQGERLAGNVGELTTGTLDRPGMREVRYRRLGDLEGDPRLAVVRVFVVTGGFRVLIGRDLEDRRRLGEVVRRTFAWSLALAALLGAVGAMFVARRVLRRVDAMTASAQRFMAGDLTGRLPIAGTHDELDRLAESLNLMLDRIGVLMAGMKQVSDNIAHDLKTPLTRLRNRAEAAWRQDGSAEDHRQALEAVIEEADNLIRIFNALLTIARLEAGNTAAPMDSFDAAEVARGIAELYEPAAEENGMAIVIDAPAPVTVRGSRELVGQAIANLVDNALKYGRASANAAPAPPDGGAVTVSVRAVGEGAELVVADRGEGIPEAERERVLGRFQRLESSRSQPGFGLGLSLAAAVAHLHGGALRLEDNRPGLRAVLSLPPRKAGA